MVWIMVSEELAYSLFAACVFPFHSIFHFHFDYCLYLLWFVLRYLWISQCSFRRVNAQCAFKWHIRTHTHTHSEYIPWVKFVIPKRNIMSEHWKRRVVLEAIENVHERPTITFSRFIPQTATLAHWNNDFLCTPQTFTCSLLLYHYRRSDWDFHRKFIVFWNEDWIERKDRETRIPIVTVIKSLQFTAQS